MDVLLLADDHPFFRGGMRMLLETTPDIAVVGEAATGKEGGGARPRRGAGGHQDAGDERDRSPAAPGEGFPTLTARERELLRLMAGGAANAQIARLLSLSLKTVANYVSNILGKLQVASREEAVLSAHEAGPGGGRG